MGAVYPLLNIYLTGLDPLSGSIEPRPCRLLWGNFASPRAAPQKFSARRPAPAAAPSWRRPWPCPYARGARRLLGCGRPESYPSESYLI
jgi:hypothetical protein